MTAPTAKQLDPHELYSFRRRQQTTTCPQGNLLHPKQRRRQRREKSYDHKDQPSGGPKSSHGQTLDVDRPCLGVLIG